METLNTVNTIMTILCIVAVALFAGIILFNYLNKKRRYLREDEAGFTGIDYANASEIVPFDDIKDGMIIENGGRRFSAVILTASGDFYNTSAGEMIRKQNGYISFIRTIREDISYRQSPENVNLEYTKQKYDAAYRNVEQLLYNATEDFKELKLRYDAFMERDKKAPKEIEDAIYKLSRQIKAYNWRLCHIEDQKNLCSIMSGPDSDNERFLKAYCVSWESVRGVLGDGIPEPMVYKKGKEELDGKCEQLIRALKAAGLSARRAGTEELIDLCRKHSRPLTGNLLSASDVMKNTDWDTDVIRTDSFNDMKNRYRQEMAERMLYPNGA